MAVSDPLGSLGGTIPAAVVRFSQGELISRLDKVCFVNDLFLVYYVKYTVR